MKSFLVKGKVPICKWGMISQDVWFFGEPPEGYSLAINPHHPFVILDIDKHGEVDGHSNIPEHLKSELLENHFKYATKSGTHIWLKYSGDKHLMNKSSKLSIDLRTEKGYVKWYLDKDIRSYIHLIKETSKELNIWIEKLFS